MNDTRPINLQHETCGGWWQLFGHRGDSVRFKCEKCSAEAEVAGGDDESRERGAAKEAARREKWAAMPVVERKPVRKLNRAETLALWAYGNWSEETYAAGFMSLEGGTFDQFNRELGNTSLFADYEEEFLAQFTASFSEPARDAWEQLSEAWVLDDTDQSG